MKLGHHLRTRKPTEGSVLSGRFRPAREKRPACQASLRPTEPQTACIPLPASTGNNRRQPKAVVGHLPCGLKVQDSTWACEQRVSDLKFSMLIREGTHDVRFRSHHFI